MGRACRWLAGWTRRCPLCDTPPGRRCWSGMTYKGLRRVPEPMHRERRDG